MQITIAQCDWGDAQVQDLEVLLSDVASHLLCSPRESLPGTIVVVPAPDSDYTPLTHYRRSSNYPIVIQLAVRGRHWAQFAYQFAHEFCHVLSNYERLRDSPNQWFHEALCELASVFTLRRMAERWPTQPPYPNWADYASALSDYAGSRLADENHRMPEGLKLATWLPKHEDELRQDPYIRYKNAVVAYQLLPLFEGDPSGWKAVRDLPNSTGFLKEYLRDWYEGVEPSHKPFVNRVVGAFR